MFFEPTEFAPHVSIRKRPNYGASLAETVAAQGSATPVAGAAPVAAGAGDAAGAVDACARCRAPWDVKSPGETEPRHAGPGCDSGVRIVLEVYQSTVQRESKGSEVFVRPGFEDMGKP